MPSVIYHPAYRTYSFGNDHPFSPLRVDMMLDLLETLGHRVETVEPEQASREEILSVHSEDYVRRVEELSAGVEVPDCQVFGLGTPDTPAFPGMDGAARWLVGGALHGARLICEHGAKRVLQLGGGLHHAQKSLASGFCIYNDLAIAINRLTSHGFSVAYVDIDVHHGDGVQQILYEDRRVMTISLHESGKFLFPGSGNIHELGSGIARGLKLNLPLQPFTEGASYLEVFEQVLPVALSHFRPSVLVVQAGADAYFADPLADLMLTTQDFEAIFRRLLELADAFTAGACCSPSAAATRPMPCRGSGPSCTSWCMICRSPASFRRGGGAGGARLLRRSCRRRSTIRFRPTPTSPTGRRSPTAIGRRFSGFSRRRASTGRPERRAAGRPYA